MIRSASPEPEPDYVSLKLLDEGEEGGFFAKILR